MKEKEIKVGLIRGRHEMPVDKYIFNEDISDVFDYKYMGETIRRFIDENMTFGQCMYAYPNQNDYTSVMALFSFERLVVYITGLTPVTAQLVKECIDRGAHLTLMHFNRDGGEYVPQIIS